METSKKVNRAVSRKTSSQPDNTLPADSLSEIMLGFYKTMNPISKKLTNKKPNAIWIAMSPPSQEKDSALDNLGTDLKETFKDINVLNDNQPIIYDENLQKGLETVIRKLLKKKPFV